MHSLMLVTCGLILLFQQDGGSQFTEAELMQWKQEAESATTDALKPLIEQADRRRLEGTLEVINKATLVQVSHFLLARFMH